MNFLIELKQPPISPLPMPRQGNTHLLIILKIRLISVNNNRIIVIATQSPQQLQISIVFLH